MLSSLLISMTLLETEDDTLSSKMTGFWQGILCEWMHLGDQHYHQHGTAWLFFNNKNMAKVALLLPILPNALQLLARHHLEDLLIQLDAIHGQFKYYQSA